MTTFRFLNLRLLVGLWDPALLGFLLWFGPVFGPVLQALVCLCGSLWVPWVQVNPKPSEICAKARDRRRSGGIETRSRSSGGGGTLGPVPARYNAQTIVALRERAQTTGQPIVTEYFTVVSVTEYLNSINSD